MGEVGGGAEGMRAGEPQQRIMAKKGEVAGERAGLEGNLRTVTEASQWRNEEERKARETGKVRVGLGGVNG